VQTLQLGGLFNAFGNGLVLPFTFIYLHNVRDFSLGTAGLVLATNAAVSLVAGPFSGPLVDRIGGKRMLAVSLAFLTVGFAGYAFVEHPWHGFLASAIVGIGNGAFWPSQASLIAGLTPPEARPAAFAMQRVVMNLGIGLGGLAGGLFATTSDTTTFTALFLANAASFVAYAGVLWAFVPQPLAAPRPEGARRGSYRDVVRHRVFMGLMALNAVFISAGFAQLEILPAYAKNEANVSERWIGPIFAVNTLVIVLAQLPAARLAEGRRRMPLLAAVGVVWAGSWLLVPPSGLWLAGTSAALLLMCAGAVFAVGECLHGVVQAPLVADLADPRLLGRYMAMSASSWQLGFVIGPAAGGFLLDVSPTGLWLGAAAVCLAAGGVSLLLERAIPVEHRRTPHRPPLSPVAMPVPAEAAARG
jgi:MFS family permease